MKLKLGDTIGIIALSGVCDRDKVEQSKAYFESLGYNVKLSKNIYDSNHYLAGSDEDKVHELHKFFEDSKVKLIMCARGGYGGIRLIDKIDYELIKANPKPFCGFSDVTSLLIMIYKKTGLITYHSPMACTDFAGSNVTGASVNKYTQDSFFDAVEGKRFVTEAKKVYKNGYAQGVLIGGNLATVASLCGQKFIPDEYFIFFAEDLNEPVYKIDRMFQQIFNIKKFARLCKGIILGDFLEVDNSEWLEEYLEDFSKRLKIPMVGGFKITHGSEKVTMPVGRFAQINEQKLIIP